MQLESLKVFCDLAETESFTKAAQINGVTQSAVSQTVSTLERLFKSLLVERSKKNFRLTQAGQLVYDSSRRMLELYNAMHGKVQELQGILSGPIHISTVTSIGLYELPPYLKRFMKDAPNVNVHVDYRHANEVYEEVLGSIVDLGLVAYPIRNAKLQAVVFRQDRLVLACHPQHPLAKEKVARFKTLNGQKFVSFEPDVPTRRAVDKILQQHQVDVKNELEFDSVEAVKRAVEINVGVAILPEETLKDEVATGTLVRVPLEDKYTRPLGVIYKKGKVLSPAMQHFIDSLQKPLGT